MTRRIFFCTAVGLAPALVTSRAEQTSSLEIDVAAALEQVRNAPFPDAVRVVGLVMDPAAVRGEILDYELSVSAGLPRYRVRWSDAQGMLHSVGLL